MSERERKKKARDYARELTQLARESGAPMPVLMQQSNRALVAWQAALDAHDNGNEDLAREHGRTALALEEVWKPELHPRTRLGRCRPATPSRGVAGGGDGRVQPAPSPP